MTSPRRTRNRRQGGWVELDKQTSPHSWKARWKDWNETRIDKNGRVRPTQRSCVLGYKTDKDLPTKGAAQNKWAKIRPAMLGNRRSGSNPAPTFAEFVNDKFVPEKNALRPWRPRSREKFDYLMSKALPVFGEKDLGSIATAQLQGFLVDIARKYCHDTANGLLMYFRAIFAAAVDDDLLLKSPARKLVLPATRDRKRPFLTLEQIGQLEAKLTGQDKIILQILSRCGLRAGETFGLQRQDVNFGPHALDPEDLLQGRNRSAQDEDQRHARSAAEAAARCADRPAGGGRGPVANCLVVPILEETPQGEDADIAGELA